MLWRRRFASKYGVQQSSGWKAVSAGAIDVRALKVLEVPQFNESSA
ncbi:MAG TPA: hypothetical protein VFP71_14455 [Candidatus Angelobacter sp.]|nr:hypothetical protein [Candidatus Angelobacter sp.]